MNKQTRFVIVALLYALMFFYAGVNIYFKLAGIGSYDGWTAMGDKQGRLVITTLDPNGPARLLQPGDVFVAINGVTRKEDTNIINYSLRVPAGTPYRMTVQRGDQLIEFLFHTAEFPPGKRGNFFEFLYRTLIRLLFLVIGLGVFLLRRDSYQAWLMALLFGCMGGLLNENLHYDAFNRGIESLISVARIGGFLGLPLFLHFFMNFPKRLPWVQRHSWIEAALYLPALLLILPSDYGLNRLPVFFQPIYAQLAPIQWMKRSGLFGYADVATAAYLALGLFCLGLNYRQSSTDDRRRARVALIGSSAAFLNILVAILYESFPALARIAPWLRHADSFLTFTLPLVPLSFAYAIIRHKVIPVSLIIRRGVRYLLVSRGSVLLVMLGVGVFVWFFMDALFRYFHVNDGRIVGTLSAIVAILAWQFSSRFHQRIVAPAIDRRFFRQSYDAQRLIGELSGSLQATTEIPRLLELVATKLQAALQTESVTILRKDQQSGEFTTAYACEYDRQLGYAVNCQRPSALPANSHTLRALAQTDEPLELDWPDSQPVWLNNGHLSHSFFKGELEVLQILRPVLLLPLKVKGELSGAVLLGARLGDLPFSSEDKRLVQSVVAPTSLALQNASLIEQRIEDARRREELEAENEARARELEEARQLQLSMLPKQVPELPHLEIAAYMKTATEVGGDYYDFAVSKEGTLTAAIGDATGHGLKAGTVVTATKSLFNAHAHDPSLADSFRLISRALKLMNMRGMFMALSLVRVENQTLRLTCAGMPPLFIYRAATGQIEEHLQKAVPLGSIKQYPYTEFTLPFEGGDLLLLMSDGLPERFNQNREMLGDEAIKRLFADHAATASPQALIEHLLALGEEWAGGTPQDDDITLLILKAK